MIDCTNLSITGVAQSNTWSLKAWWSPRSQRWLVQAEHHVPERGGWIRAWLADGSPNPMPVTFDDLSEAHERIRAFAEAPHWDHCREYPTGV